MTLTGTFRSRRRIQALFGYSITVIATIIVVAPLVWIVTTSIRPLSEVISFPPRVIPETITFQAYSEIWDAAPFLGYLANSLLVSVVAATVALVVASLAAYGFVRFRFRGAKILMVLILLSQALPGASILLPVVQVVARYGMIDTRPGLIFVYTAFVTPFSAWLLVGYFRSIPAELQDAGLVDGLSHVGVLFRIVMRLAAPAIFAVWAFAFLVAWNEFFFAFVLTSRVAVTIPVGMVTELFNQYTTMWHQISAASVVFSLPPLFLLVPLQRHLVSGLTVGSVK